MSARPARPASPSPLPAVALGLAGVLFVVYPALRPWGDLDPAGMSGAFSSMAWPLAHLAAVVGFVLVGLGLREFGRGAEVTWWLGAALVLPYYGAEALALHVLGGRMTGGELAATAEAIRMGGVAMTVFGAGLVLLAVSGVLVAVRERAAAVPFAVAMVLFLPQFFLPPAARIAHGVLLGVGCVLLAVRAHRPAAEGQVAAKAVRNRAPARA